MPFRTCTTSSFKLQLYNFKSYYFVTYNKPIAMQIQKKSLSDKFSLFHDHWNPRVVAQLNGQSVKLVKFQGEFVWHQHETEDELFLVVKGYFNMELRDQTIRINEGEFIVIPRGTEHRPVAPEEVQVLLFEPDTTLNTGDAATSDLTRNQLNSI